MTTGTDREVAALVAVIGDRLQLHFDEICERMTDVIAREVDFLNDPELMAMLRASVEGNITTILRIIRHDIPFEQVQPITAATEYAFRLAQRGVPGTSLRRAYHFGSDDLRDWMFDEVEALDCEAGVKLRLLNDLSRFLHRYIDWITQIVLEAHEQERQRWLDKSASVTSQLVARILDGHAVDQADFASGARYRLDQVHVGAVIWIDGANSGTDHTGALRDFARGLAEPIGAGATLFTAVDRGTAWVWFGRGRSTAPVDVELVRRSLARTPDARVALGCPVAGVDGFRRTHQQAEAAMSVALRSSSPVTHAIGFGERGVAVASMLVRDLEAARHWVAEVLGPLAVDGEAEARTRETLRVFLGTGGGYAQTSEQLLLHRNSVKYRISKVEAERGRPLDPDRLDLELAVQVCHYLGAAVLVADRR
ncbi:PucR family transcriptional regulator [Aeromicrobium sp. UC242_57]|uniref:PucR family transcriptional regulator n=1 Tax=Aeromicrobium sp. UC242_57 TaxID=3374624 RepID=UPI003788EEBA